MGFWDVKRSLYTYDSCSSASYQCVCVVCWRQRGYYADTCCFNVATLNLNCASRMPEFKVFSFISTLHIKYIYYVVYGVQC